MSKGIVSDILHYCHVKPEGCSKIDNYKIGFFDLTFVLEGCMEYEANGKSIILHSNDAMFLTPQTLRSRKMGDCFVEYVSFNFQLKKGATLELNTYIPKCITVNIKRLLSLYQETHISNQVNSLAKCECLLNYILFELLDESTVSNRNPHVTKMLEYINKHETEKITLKDISDYTHLSMEYCSYLFKHETGQTLINYINEKKISIAKALITKKEMSLTDICSYLDFNNYNYFSRLFKKHVGVSPFVFSAEWDKNK